MRRLSNLKWATRLLLMLAVAGGAAAWVTGCGPNPATTTAGEGSKTRYTCGMHPQVIQDKPGNCPICGMKLTPMRKTPGGVGSATTERKIKYYKSTMLPGEVRATPGKDSMGMDMVPVYEESSAGTDSQTIAVDPATTQTMGIRTATVSRGPLRRIIRTVGAIDYNETGLVDVTTKFKGWIERLYVDATGQQVHRGDPLFEIYSPDLYSAQREYLLATAEERRERKPGENEAVPPSGAPRTTIATSALTKLKFYDISEEQIANLERSREPSKTLRILAPIDGFVIDKTVVQGQMVDPGMKMYRLADLGLVWVQAQIYEQDLGFIKLGQEATVTLWYLPDREFRGRVTYIYPNLDEKTRTARVRMEFHNPGYFLKPGMFATVQVVCELEPSVLLVPDMAILRSGEKNTVFVALAEGKFEARSVTLGPQAENDMYQVLAGLKEGERIVTSGQFMLDSESQLREAVQKMGQPQATSLTATTPSDSSPRTNASAPYATGTQPATIVKCICPMPEHVSIQYDRPGQCPICGMTLVPVTAAALAKLQPGGKLLYYTCPMPEHTDVHSDKPGKCPKCGMTLIPVMEVSMSRDEAVPRSMPNATRAAPPPILYTCPMASDADVVSDKPGKCPKCEMDLVPTTTVSHGKLAEENWHKSRP